MKNNKIILLICLLISTVALSQNKGIEEKEYYDNGKLYSIGNSIDEVETGEWKWYHENGQLEEIGRYNEGIKVGEWKTYDDTGKLEESIKYFDGKLSDNFPPIQKYLDNVKDVEFYEGGTTFRQKISANTFTVILDSKDIKWKQTYSNIDWSEYQRYGYEEYDDLFVFGFFFYEDIDSKYSDNDSGENNEKVSSFLCKVWPKDKEEVLKIIEEWDEKLRDSKSPY